jgi:MarR family transcriptional regulator, organic hydroperoxide resistance regulator
VTGSNRKTSRALTRDVLAHVQGVVEQFAQYAQALAAAHELSIHELDALRRLGDPPISQRELGDALQLDPSKVTDMVDRLEARRLVQRVVDPDDRRIRRIVLTTKGVALRHTLIEQSIDDSPISQLPRADREALRDLLAKIAPPIPVPD